MRIVHISDIHLSKENFSEFKNNYRAALLKVLVDEHNKKPIDIICITGDLVDQGGHSLLELSEYPDCEDPYFIFEQEFISPIKLGLSISNPQFLFVPGNHDINESEILWIDEKELQRIESEGEIEELLNQNKIEFNKYNQRIEKFKNFERRFHIDTPNYKYSNNESTYVFENGDGIKIGFTLLNDSWRCSTCQLIKYKDKGLYFGKQQLYDSLETIRVSDTVCNILLAHHPLSSYGEEEEISRIIAVKEYHLHLFGDKHEHKYTSYIVPTGDCFGIMARAALNNPEEPNSKWQPGFHIIDVNLYDANIERVTFYKYIYDRSIFGVDSDTAPPYGYDETKRKLSFTPVQKGSKVVKKHLDINKFYRP